MLRRFGRWASQYPAVTWQALAALAAVGAVAVAVIVPLVLAISGDESGSIINSPPPTPIGHASQSNNASTVTLGSAQPSLWIQSLGVGPESEGWEGDVEAPPGSELQFYASIHNHSEGDSMPCLQASFPQEVLSDGFDEVEFSVSLADASPPLAQDKVIVRSQNGVRLEYIENSVHINTDVDGDGVREDGFYVAEGERLFAGCLPLGHVIGFDVVMVQLGFALRALPSDADASEAP